MDRSSGHVQIAQVPGRNEPDSAGELDYRYLLTTLEKLQYQGYIGCEYKPLGQCSFCSIDDGTILHWILMAFVCFRLHQRGSGLDQRLQQTQPVIRNHTTKYSIYL